jgi:beta-lactamase superfamily II metal-dependent hydrolase
LPAVARRYRVKNFIYAPDEYVSPAREVLLDYLDEQSARVAEIISAGKVNLGTACGLEFFNPAILNVSPDGNNSLITKLICREKSFLFSGDNEPKVERALLTSGFDFTADVFKASHHGSKTSNAADFLHSGGFRVLIISVGDNRFGHPSPEVLATASQLGLSLHRTDQEGDIKFIVK